MEEYYVGTDLKFRIDLKSDGFSMDDDNFMIDVYMGSIKKTYTKESLAIGADGYYLPISTADLPPCTVKMVVTAFVPDSDMPNGIRREVGVTTLCTVKKTI